MNRVGLVKGKAMTFCAICAVFLLASVTPSQGAVSKKAEVEHLVAVGEAVPLQMARRGIPLARVLSKRAKVKVRRRGKKVEIGVKNVTLLVLDSSSKEVYVNKDGDEKFDEKRADVMGEEVTYWIKTKMDLQILHIS